MKEYSALLDHMGKKVPKSNAQIVDGLNLIKEPIQSLEATFRPDGVKRPKIGAISSLEMEQSSRNMDCTDELEREGEVDEWVPPSNQKGDGRTNLNEKYGY